MGSASPLVAPVDDDESVHESISDLLREFGYSTRAFSPAKEFLGSAVVDMMRCLIADIDMPEMTSCLVLHISMPGINGLELQQRIAVERVWMPIIFITGHGDVPTSVQAMKAGPVEFLTKPFRDDTLLTAVREASGRSRVALAAEFERRAIHECHATLTRRERQVLGLVVSGRLNKQIAGELGLNEITVKAHRGRVRRKMKADSLADPVKMAAKLGPGSRG